MKTCKRCSRRRAVINFCDECAKYINRAHDQVFERTEAAVGYLRLVKPAYRGFNDDAQKRFKRETLKNDSNVKRHSRFFPSFILKYQKIAPWK